MITVSIVSHNHGKMVSRLIFQLLKFSQISKIIVTLNIPEKIKFIRSKKVQIIVNKKIKGFAENHNQAFFFCKSKFFCVLNPDIIFIENPFGKLIKKTEKIKTSVTRNPFNKGNNIEQNLYLYEFDYKKLPDCYQ
jgi:GT2 family glycosyltransferase